MLIVMSANEQFAYDILFRVIFDLAVEIYACSSSSNPLGATLNTAVTLQGKVTDPRILEYKFSIDSLIEDLDEQNKNVKDIDLCVAWETGTLYKERLGITSLLVPENADQRGFHGVMHFLNDLDSGNKSCDLIILSELIEYLNDQERTAEINELNTNKQTIPYRFSRLRQRYGLSY